MPNFSMFGTGGTTKPRTRIRPGATMFGTGGGFEDEQAYNPNIDIDPVSIFGTGGGIDKSPRRMDPRSVNAFGTGAELGGNAPQRNPMASIFGTGGGRDAILKQILASIFGIGGRRGF